MRFRPLRPDFGVEVLGFDVRRSSDPAQVDQLRAALDEHQILLFRGGGRLTPERQIEITGWFGPLSNHLGGEPYTVLRNEEESGRRQLPFHSDLSYTDSPIKVISLHPIALPPGGTSTSFVSGVRAWERLPLELQERLAPMTLRHTHVSPHFDWEFIADHPVRKLHPRSGRPILYVTEHHAHRIQEMGAQESGETLSALYDVLYDPAHLYTHYWQPEDLVIWDNLALQHARREAANLSDGERAVQRVALNEFGFPELVERARVKALSRAGST